MKKGKKYNRLTAIKFHHIGKWGDKYWLFKCECGKENISRASSVKSGDTKSCGCLTKEIAKLKSVERITHGMSKTREYKIWASMRDRAGNLNNKRYKDYLGRGITICNRWLKFENFYQDMGDKPKGLSIDRINNNKGYSKENCRWATASEQQNNRRENHSLTFKNKTQTIAQWAKEVGLEYGTLASRINRSKWSVEKALTY